MDFDDFFKAFHIGGNDGYLMGYTTTWSIPKFFVETVLTTEAYRTKLPQDDMSYDKWFQGNSSPRNHWANMAKDYDEKNLVAALMSALDNENLPKFLQQFEIESAEPVNKSLLCVAIAQQFKSIIDGKGKADDCIRDVYLSGNIKADFTDYISKATQRYNVMKLIGGTEVPLADFFICNTIGEKEKVFADKQRIKCVYLDEPDLDKIRDIYKQRRYDNLKTVLIGSGGCGKSLMLQHLFMTAANEYKKTGILPVFLELRYFTQSDDVFSFIVKTVFAKDENFTDEAARMLLSSGRIRLLLDGFDEIDPSDVNSFLTKLGQFTDKYDKVQVVITSRQNESITGLNGYVKLYVWPFDNDQSMSLIDRILTYQGQLVERDAVIQYISNGFLKKDGVFASHPLLLTYVAMKYPSYSRYNDNPSLFYKATYEALLSGHDDNKKPYDRVFMSVDNADQFSAVFKQFCALSYKDGVLQFDTTTFDAYFYKLTAHQHFENPHKMTLKNFKHDVCSTACMMYEQDVDIFYIDPGFQEFLFAEYYYQAGEEEMNELVHSLINTSFATIGRFDALDMLRRTSELKFKTCVLLPFLETIYTSDDMESFIRFLQNGFDEIQIINIDEVCKSIYLLKINPEVILYPHNENHAKSILLNYILRELGIDQEYAFCLYTKDNVPIDGAFKRVKITEDIVISGKLLGQETEVDEKKAFLIDCKPVDAFEYISIIQKNEYKNDWLVDADNNVVCFGNRITVDSYDISANTDDYMELIENVKSNSKGTYNIFLQIKQYCKQLKRERHRNR